MRRCLHTAAVTATIAVATDAASIRPFTSGGGQQQQQHYQRGGGRRGRGGGGGSYRNNSHNSGGGGNSNRHRGGPIKDRYPPLTVDHADPRRRLAILIDGTNVNLLGSAAAAASREDLFASSSLFTNVLPAIAKVGVPVLLRVFAHQLPTEWDPLVIPNYTPPAGFSSSGGGGGASAINDGGSGGGESNPAIIPAPSAASSSSTNDGNDSSNGTGISNHGGRGGIVVEYFRVERFIPIPMQMEADAQHLYDFRFQNKIQGVCYVCHEVDRALYSALMSQQLGRNNNTIGGGGPDAIAASMLLPPIASSGSNTDGNGNAAVRFFNQYLLDELGMVKEEAVDGRSADGA